MTLVRVPNPCKNDLFIFNKINLIYKKGGKLIITPSVFEGYQWHLPAAAAKDPPLCGILVL
jgi:virulence-associated protein VagC